ncbi:MAG: hypothetical protein NUV54_03275, partial [Candidatus Taylorbacteria bacterium]|nr:hypothetical protein [Candidatus Taylorbacteria bacterium]
PLLSSTVYVTLTPRILEGLLARSIAVNGIKTVVTTQYTADSNTITVVGDLPSKGTLQKIQELARGGWTCDVGVCNRYGYKLKSP